MLILPIGDCHVSADDDLDRFLYLGQYIIEKKPDYIVFMGDFLTFQCLSGWDRDKRMKMEGKRYKKEIDTGNKALDIIFYPLNELQDRQRKNKEKIYRPEIIYLNGNHENRLDRYLESDPTFEGLVSVDQDLKLRERGIKFIPYREYYYINDIAFTHIPFNKAKEISGVNITKKVSQVMFGSVVFAHTHCKAEENFKRHGQDDLQQVLVVGCFFEDEEDYIHGRIIEYWKGLVLLDSFKPGRFDMETTTLEKMRMVREN